MVLDDAVVHDRDVAGDVRVGVELARPAVRGPARVADAGRARRAVRFASAVVEVRELADGAHDLDALAVVHGEAGRVVAAVFEPAQAVDKMGVAWRGPTYPTIPHMGRFCGLDDLETTSLPIYENDPIDSLDPSRKALTSVPG